MPTSMLIPDMVRINQYGRIATRESSHSVPVIHIVPCINPAIVSTIPIMEIPNVISQNDQLPSLNDQSS